MIIMRYRCRMWFAGSETLIPRTITVKLTQKMEMMKKVRITLVVVSKLKFKGQG